jgi:hypothetical protein
MRKLAVASVIALVLSVLAIVPTAQAYVTKSQALNYTFNYAHNACYVDSHCRAYAASQCVRHSGGVSCWAWNYEQRSTRYTCKRLVFWKSRYNRQFLTPWKCSYPGWNWGPGVGKRKAL